MTLPEGRDLGLRVLILARFFLSGQTTHVVTLATALRKQGIRPVVACVQPCHLEAWHTYSLELQKSGVPCRLFADSRELLSELQFARADVIHCHSSDLIPAARALSRATGRPVVVTCHGLGVAARQPALKEVEAVIAVGVRVRTDLLEHGLRDVFLIGNGIDTAHFAPGRKVRPLQVAYVGRVDAGKRPGLRALVEAVGSLPGARLVLLANEKPSAPWCDARGWQADVAPVLAESHVVCGTGRAIREGMASGCVALVLGNRYGGIVSPRYVAALPEGFPSFSGLEGAPPTRERIRADLVGLLSPQRRGRLARWSRTYACRHFSAETMARRTVLVYEEALRRR